MRQRRMTKKSSRFLQQSLNQLKGFLIGQGEETVLQENEHCHVQDDGEDPWDAFWTAMGQDANSVSPLASTRLKARL